MCLAMQERKGSPAELFDRLKIRERVSGEKRLEGGGRNPGMGEGGVAGGVEAVQGREQRTDGFYSMGCSRGWARCRIAEGAVSPLDPLCTCPEVFPLLWASVPGKVG